MKYRITTQAELRRAFWQTFPNLSRKRVKDFEGTGKMYVCDTRCAFCDWIDNLNYNGEISDGLMNKVTL